MSRAVNNVKTTLGTAALYAFITAVVVFGFIFFGSGYGFAQAAEAGIGLGVIVAVLWLIR